MYDFFSDVRDILVQFLQTVNRDFSQEFANAVSSLGPEATESVQNLFTTSSVWWILEDFIREGASISMFSQCDV